VVNTRVEREAVADGKHIEMGNLVVHELSKREVLNSLSSDWRQGAQLIQEEVRAELPTPGNRSGDISGVLL